MDLKIEFRHKLPSVAAEPISFAWDQLSLYPGIYEQGSEAERLILRRRQEAAEDRINRFDIRHTGALVEHGLIDAELSPDWSCHLSVNEINNSKMATYYDVQTMVEIDWRLRWCRCALDHLGIPYDREPVIFFETKSGSVSWTYVSEASIAELALAKPVDPIEFLLVREPHFTTAWYALKILAHYRRIEALTQRAGNQIDASCAIGLAREWMLFGQTWAEAEFIINHSSLTISGAKQRKGARNGSVARAKSNSSAKSKLLAEMRTLRAQFPAQSVAWIADRAFRTGYGRSKESNRKAWYRSERK